MPDGCACGQFSEAQAKNEQYKAQEAELQEQIREQKERSKEIDKFEEYVKTDDYIKDMAEDRLNLWIRMKLYLNRQNRRITNEDSGESSRSFSV